MALRGKFPERYKGVIAYIKRGHTTLHELIDADFVQHPKELDIVRGPDVPVKIKSIFSTGFGWKKILPEFSNVFIIMALPLYMKILYGGYLASETYKKLKTLGGFTQPHKSPNVIFINDYLRLFTRSQKGRRIMHHTAMHERKHVVQARDAKISLSSALTGTRIPMDSYVYFPEDDDKAKLLKYLVHEAEVQARLTTVILGAYHQFERVPLNKLELIACLQSQGLIIPEGVLKKFERKTGWEQARSKFVLDQDWYDRYADQMAIRQLNSVVVHLKSEVSYEFFNVVLPFIYGDIIELWEDRLGQKRMGLSHNIQLREMFYRAVHDTNKIKYKANKYRMNGLSEEAIKETISAPLAESEVLAMHAVDTMVEEDAISLAEKIIRGEPYQEFSFTTVVCDIDDCDLGMKAVRAIISKYSDSPNIEKLRIAFEEERQTKDLQASTATIHVMPKVNPREFWAA